MTSAPRAKPRGRERLHLRLNERRERLRRHLSGPLILVGRPDWKEPARRGAPDLWSQRTVVLEWTPEARPVVGGSFGDVHTQPEREVPDATSAARGLGRAIARGDAEGEAIARTRLALAHLAEGRPGNARDEAVAAIAIAPPGATKARAYAALARAEATLGDVSGAETHYGLALAQPGVPEVVRDLALALGRLHTLAPAPAIYAEALELATTLAERWPTPDHAEVLDWVRSLGP